MAVLDFETTACELGQATLLIELSSVKFNHEISHCRAKEVKAENDRRSAAASRAATALDRSTRRRTKFDFDLWDAEGKAAETARTEIGSAIAADEWIDGNMRLHNLKSTRSLVRKLPDDFRRELSRLNKVEVPHPGASYNPSYSDHQVSRGTHTYY